MIKFTFTPQFRDYWRLNCHFVVRTTKRLRWIAAALVCLYLLSPWLIRVPGQERAVIQSYVSFLPVLILPGILAFMFIATFINAKKRWKNSEELRTGKEYEITDQGVQIRGDGVNGFLDWRHFSSAELSGGWFFLKTAQNAFHYFPLAAVPNAADLVALTKRKIEQTKELR